MNNLRISQSLSRVGNGMTRLKESGIRSKEDLRMKVTRRMQSRIRNSMQLIVDMDFSLRNGTRVMK